MSLAARHRILSTMPGGASGTTCVEAHMKRSTIAALICIWGMGTAPPASAVDLHDVVTDYVMTSWTQKDGLPPAVIRALVQDQEGYLWVGTDSGLFRFDGVRFTQVVARSAIRALCRGHDNSLWAGLGGHGGVTRLYKGAIRAYDEQDGLPNTPVNVLVQDGRGAIWAGTASGLFRFENDRWSRWRQGLPEGEIYGAYVDSSANLLVGMAEGLFRRPPGAGTFDLLESSSESRLATSFVAQERQPRAFAQDASGRLWESDRISGFRRVNDGQHLDSMPVSGRGYALLFDDKQSLWVGTIGQGLWRIQRKPNGEIDSVERATSLTGLPSDGVFCLFEDRDGNIWVGTDEGLSRLVLRRVSQLTNFGIVIGLGVTAAGDIWIGAVDELIRFVAGKKQPSARLPIPQGRLKAMYVEQGGTVWAATDDAIIRYRPPEYRLEPVIGSETLTQVGALTSDGHGGLVIADGVRGFMRWNKGDLKPFLEQSPAKVDRAAVLHTDRHGNVWIALGDGSLIVVAPDGSQQLFDERNGLTAGVIRQMYERDDGEMWLAASNGLLRYAEGRFSPVGDVKQIPLHDITALVADRGQSLWVGTNFGIVRIDQNPSIATSKADAPPQYTVYDRSDGLAGSPLAYNSNLRVVRGPDNLLWFVTARGVSIIDPSVLPKSRTAGATWIEDVVVDDKSFGVTQDIRLPSHTTRINIRYTVVDLTAPFRTRFRYRLEGFDSDWIDADARREAFYTNLPPRRYRFSVVATAGQGAWHGPASTWTFSVAPRFYQTSWFYAAVAALGLFSLWGTWQLRLTAVRRNFAMLLHERARLSRDIHDTLLQSLVGVSLQFDVLANDDQTLSEFSRARFGRMRKQLEEHIREARQSILQLRSPRLERGSLITALRDIGEQAAAGTSAAFVLTVEGDIYPLPRKVELQIFRIGQEAILNAVRHSKGSSIAVTLAYSHDALTLLVEDDGTGFSEDAVGRQSSHYGLVSMKERAMEIRSDLTIDSQPGHGMSVRLIVPVLRWKNQANAQ
jgi:signal transduction histidine kinase/ligand-binding sensor domain-containing protein